jgi:RNA polymerase-binding transcription factor DksA
MATALKPDEVTAYREKLEHLKARLRGDLDQMTDSALHRNGPNSNGNLSSVPIHMADLGTDAFEQDFTLGLIETEQVTLDQVESALARIRSGRFGTCETCGGPIARPRLEAIPYASHCIECARQGEPR